mgnify:CR=1 FL=1
MGDMKLFAGQYATEHVLAACDPATNGLGVAFGFLATYVRVENLAAVPIHVNLNSTSPATTDHPELQPRKNFTLTGVRVYGCGVSTTSTTTSTGAGRGHRVTVAAFGG